MELPGVPDDLLNELRSAALSARVPRLALVGGAVRDGLLHQRHGGAWAGVPDLDLVVEGEAVVLADALMQRCGLQRVTRCITHGAFATVELCLDGQALDLATARAERYPASGQNPIVTPGSLEEDLVRRDFTINAMAVDLVSGALIDRHGGQAHLAARQLVFLHAGSVADDPTRLIRAARYGARLGFDLSLEARRQVDDTLRTWPWSWNPGEGAQKAPPALATRLRMELDRLLLHEPWLQALELLQGWGAMVVLDPALQADSRWRRRLRWARRLGVPLMPVLLSGAADPAATARRLQIPGQQLGWLDQLPPLRAWLRRDAPSAAASAAVWTEAIERRGWRPDVVALAICSAVPQWRPLLRWWGRWRRCTAPVTARQLIADGWEPGPALGAELQRQRLLRLEQGR